MTGPSFRPPRPEELADCALVWHAAVDHYTTKLGRPLPPPALEPLIQLNRHLLATDPDRFLVAVEPGGPRRPDRILGYGIATQRDRVWFLSQLYVLPAEQGAGLGRALLTQILPSGAEAGAADAGRHLEPGVLATATDSAQPASNGLYGGLGIVPRMPVLNLVGRPSGESVRRPLPTGVQAIPFEDLAGGHARGPGSQVIAGTTALDDAVAAIDRAVLGYAHPEDHRYLQSSGRNGFLYRAADGEALGYGYTSAVGRFGPVALLDETLTAAVLAHLLTVIEPRGATSAWVPGHNDRAMVALLRAGLRVEGFPALLCWTRPFAAFERYLPAGLALL